MLKIGRTYRDQETGRSGKLSMDDGYPSIGGFQVQSVNLTRVHSNEYFFFVGLAFLLVLIAAFAG